MGDTFKNKIVKYSSYALGTGAVVLLFFGPPVESSINPQRTSDFITRFETINSSLFNSPQCSYFQIEYKNIPSPKTTSNGEMLESLFTPPGQKTPTQVREDMREDMIVLLGVQCVESILEKTDMLFENYHANTNSLPTNIPSEIQSYMGCENVEQPSGFNRCMNGIIKYMTGYRKGWVDYVVSIFFPVKNVIKRENHNY